MVEWFVYYFGGVFVGYVWYWYYWFVGVFGGGVDY